MYHQLRPASRLRPVITAAILAACAYPALAGTVIWNVNASGLWTAPTNWSSNPALPGPADDVLINQSNPITVTLSHGAQTVNSLIDNNTLSLNSGANLTVGSGLQVNGAFQLNGGALQNTTLSVAPSAVVNFINGTLANDTLSGNITQTGCVTLTGTVTNNANWTQSSSGNSLNISNITTLDGNGTITLFHANLQTLSGNATLNVGPNQTLQGSMNALTPQLLINNSGTINANVANTTISIFYPFRHNRPEQRHPRKHQRRHLSPQLQQQQPAATIPAASSPQLHSATSPSTDELPPVVNSAPMPPAKSFFNRRFRLRKSVLLQRRPRQRHPLRNHHPKLRHRHSLRHSDQQRQLDSKQFR